VNNLIDGTVVAADRGERRLRVETALGDLFALFDERLQVGDRCILCIRPENATVSGEPAPGRNRVEGRITFAAYLGNTLRYDVELGPGVIFKADVRDPWHHELLPIGTAVVVTFPASSTIAIREER
jgi:ABC-type Fe3+/spermidine/putrescine transport system ATPase subunit